MRRIALLLLPVTAACGTEHHFVPPEKPPVAEPPGEDPTDLGDAPDWQNCLEGWRTQYSNLEAEHPWVTPRARDGEVPTTVDGLAELWEDPEFETFEAVLDFPEGWWPVDDGLEGDPAYFAVHAHAWIRAWSGTTLSFLLGSSDDSFVSVNGEAIAEKPGIHPLVRDRYDIGLEAGQYPIELWFAHRGSPQAALSFRVIEGDVSICYPEFTEDPGTP